MASMMDEMAKTLARRRAAAEKKQPEQPPVSDDERRRLLRLGRRYFERSLLFTSFLTLSGAGELAGQEILGQEQFIEQQVLQRCRVTKVGSQEVRLGLGGHSS